MTEANGSADSLTSQIVFDDTESKYFLKRGSTSLDLPVLNKKGLKANADDLVGVSERLDVLLRSVGGVLDDQRFSAVSKSRYKAGEAIFKCLDNSYQNFIYKRYPDFPYSSSTYTSVEKAKLLRAKDTFADGSLFRVTYRSNGSFAFQMNPNVEHMLNSSTDSETFDYKKVADYDTCLGYLKALRKKLDGRLTSEGYEPTLENRSNLLSLVLGLNLTLARNYEISRRIGAGNSKRKLNIDQPMLIRAAAEGYNDGILKIFYINNYYPANAEELKSFKNIPYDMLDNILGGERQ